MWHTILKSLCTGRAVACAVITLAQCFAQVDAKAMTIETDGFGKTKSGADVTKFTVTNSSGMKATLIDYGAILQSLEVPDRDGNIAEVTMGFDTVTEYEDNSPYFGATVGRYANRIEGGRFTLDGKEYQLATNNGPNHLHGGVVGLDKVSHSSELSKNLSAVVSSERPFSVRSDIEERSEIGEKVREKLQSVLGVSVCPVDPADITPGLSIGNRVDLNESGEVLNLVDVDFGIRETHTETGERGVESCQVIKSMTRCIFRCEENMQNKKF